MCILVDVFGFEAVSQPGGFLLPGKNEGALNIVDLRDFNNPVTHDVSTSVFDPDEWFYHRATWMDMDKDGDLDAFMCRANVNRQEGIGQFVF